MVVQLYHTFLAFGLVNSLLIVIDWLIPSSTQKMDQETLKALLHRSVRIGDLEAVKKYIAAGAPLTEWIYEAAMEGGHKDVVEYFHTLGRPDLRSEKLLYTVANGFPYLTGELIRAGAVPTAEHLDVATEEMRPLLLKAMSAPAPAPEEYCLPITLVFTNNGTMHVRMPDNLKNVPSYVRYGTYKTAFTFTLGRTETGGPARIPQPVLPAPRGPAAPAGYVPKEPRVLHLRSRKITFA
jgi:hypothetical protein